MTKVTKVSVEGIHKAELKLYQAKLLLLDPDKVLSPKGHFCYCITQINIGRPITLETPTGFRTYFLSPRAAFEGYKRSLLKTRVPGQQRPDPAGVHSPTGHTMDNSEDL